MAQRGLRRPKHPRYEIVRTLGRGGHGTVYLARDLLEGKRAVALKVARSELPPEEILREFRILRELRHPGIARAHDFGRLPGGGGAAYFTLDYIAGTDLEREAPRLRKKWLRGEWPPLLDVIFQITSALGYLHDKGLLHLDVKPSNILFSRQGIKLIDFDLFHNCHAGDVIPARGTAYYMAPEVVEGGPIDARSDLYSLGVTLYRTLTGRYPITGSSSEEILENHRRMTPRAPKGLPEELVKILMRLLAKSPQRRYASTRELDRALSSLLSGREDLPVTRVEEADFVGRKRELDRFFHWLDRLQKGESSGVFLIEGEAGVGKSRLADAATTEALLQGVGVLRLRSYAGREFDGLSRMVSMVSETSLKEKSARRRFAFLFTCLGLASYSRVQREIQDLDREQLRARVFREALEFFGETIETPLVFLLEDIHHADESFQDFLRRWSAGPVERQKLCLLLTARPDTMAHAASDRCDPEGSTTLRLRGLTREDLRRIARELRPSLKRDVQTRLIRACGGNPGLLLELIRRLDRADGRGRAGSRVELGALAREHLSELDASERAIVRALSLLSWPADDRFLRRVTGLTRRPFDRGLESLERSGLIRGERSGRYLDPDLDPGDWTTQSDSKERLAMHERIGQALRRTSRRRGEAAVHLLKAGDVPLGLEEARRAVLELQRTGRVEEALRVIDSALPHAEGHELEMFFLENLGDFCEKTGQFDRAGEAYDRLLGDSRPGAADRARLLRKRGGIHQRRGDPGAAQQTFEAALQIFDSIDHLDEYLSLLSELAACHLFLGEFEPASIFANRGLEMLRARGAEVLTADRRSLHALSLHALLGNILLRQFEYDRSAEEFQKGLKYARAVRSNVNTPLILNNLGIAYHQSNQLKKALAVYRRASALSKKTGDETSLFSIQCNLAGVRARMGEVQAATEMLEELGRMPHAARSRRARLFLLHSRALVNRLTLTDSRKLWESSIRLAEELGDPLVANVGRVSLLENEIFQGRWRSARRTLDALRALDVKDAKLERAILVRQAHLEALCGNTASASDILRETLESQHPLNGRSRKAYQDLWDAVFIAATLIELDKFERAEEILTGIKRCFDTSGQPAGSLECALLLSELKLRQQDPVEARRSLAQAQEAVALCDVYQDSRMALVRIPLLEARLGLQTPGTRPGQISRWLAGARANLPYRSSLEWSWVVDLVASELGEPESARRLAISRRRFLSAVELADRKSYVARDHRLRFGLAARDDDGPAGATSADVYQERKRLDTLARLSDRIAPGRALDTLLEATDATRGAFFLKREPGIAAVRGFALARRDVLERIRHRALNVDTGPCGKGFCVAFVLADDPRETVTLYLETKGRGGGGGSISAETQSYLRVATRVLSSSLTVPTDLPRHCAETTPRLVRSAIRTPAVSVEGVSLAPPMQEVLDLIRRTRESSLPVLLIGESGSGKDYLARWIHVQSPRASKPFVGQDCHAIPEGLLEAELFGHEAGAFTGATRRRSGYLLAANGGTFYLDNVDSLSMEVQAKLLRFLETNEVRPLGAATTIPIDVRIIASSQQDLKSKIARGEFRDDLYFRLAGICLTVPPLRQRAEDLPALIRHFLSQIPGTAPDLKADAMEALSNYTWPGNVRELESVIRRLALTAEGSVRAPDVLRALGTSEGQGTFPRAAFQGKTFEEFVTEAKREYLLYLFDQFEGDLDRIARAMGTSKRNVYLRFAQANLRPTDLRSRGAAK